MISRPLLIRGQVGLQRVVLVDFRCFSYLEVELSTEGITVIHGPNGSGKTSIIEAIGFVLTHHSIRTSNRDSLVRQGSEIAWAELDVSRGGVARTLVAVLRKGRQPLFTEDGKPVRSNLVDIYGGVVWFTPRDMGLIQEGPHVRRDLLDSVIRVLRPRGAMLVAEVERCLRQRNALLKQLGHRHGRIMRDASRQIARGLGMARAMETDTGDGQGHGELDVDQQSPSDIASLDVWDERLAAAGTTLVCAREEVCKRLAPLVTEYYNRVSGSGSVRVEIAYGRSWNGELLSALRDSRESDLRRQTTEVGPHRDELQLFVDGRLARFECSQGEQRVLAIALRLATFSLLAEEDPMNPPVLLLDDVFSELDSRRAEALVRAIPCGQVLITTAHELPRAMAVTRKVGLSGEADSGARAGERARLPSSPGTQW